MTTWIRRRPRGPLEELTTLWHVEGEAPGASIASPLQAWGACGSALGIAVDVRPGIDEPDAGDRCPACQGRLLIESAEVMPARPIAELEADYLGPSIHIDGPYVSAVRFLEAAGAVVDRDTKTWTWSPPAEDEGPLGPPMSLEASE